MLPRCIPRAGTALLLATVVVAVSCATASPPREGDAPISRETGRHSAIDLRTAVMCSETELGTSLVMLSWSYPAAADSTEFLDMRIGITALRERSEKGDFDTAWQLSRDRSLDYSVEGRYSVSISRLRAGVNYYWRVLTRTRQGWVPSETARAEAPVCPS